MNSELSILDVARFRQNECVCVCVNLSKIRNLTLDSLTQVKVFRSS